MTQCWVGDVKFSQECTCSGGWDSQPSLHASLRSRNVFQLLALREISPCTKNSSKRFWHQNSKSGTDVFGPKCEIVDARKSLASWVEADSLSNLTANYCPLLPPPRSTIAAAFSSDGKTLASTHGDHTVKIIDCQTGSCLKVLTGHRRTPWVVRFHPLHSEILASGSLDQEVRLWDAHTAACIRSHDFYRPIASIAFHAQGEVLAVASGHKLFMWQYNNRRGESSIPISVLKTKRSLRAVHFHPYAAPLLLTAEVNNLDLPDHPLSLATTPGYPQYPPASFVTNIEHSTHIDDETRMPIMPSRYFWPTFVGGGGQSLQQYNIEAGTVNWQQRAEFSRQQAYSNMGSHHNDMADPMEVSLEPYSSNLAADIAIDSSFLAGREVATGYSDSGNMVNINGSDTVWREHRSSDGVIERMDAVLNGESSTFGSSTGMNSSTFSGNNEPEMPIRSAYDGHFQQNIPFTDLTSWQLPFLQSCVLGQTNISLNMMPPVDGALQGLTTHGLGFDLLTPDQPPMHTVGTGHRRNARQNLNHHRSRSHRMVSTESGEAAAELPCTVRLRIWSHDIQVPCAPLDPGKCLLTIPHAVLCSEMGAHFSPCGRFLAACVACVLPRLEGDHELQSLVTLEATATSPTQHPLSAHQVTYELRIYSLEEATFGSILASRVIRAAHCLTSIQFSPTSEHLLLAYGRRHGSLHWRKAMDEEIGIHTYTIMEIYRVSDMELVRVLPSSDDEVNVACFHPLAGGGLVYGTKEGKLRIFQYDGPRGASSATGRNSLFEEKMPESSCALNYDPSLRSPSDYC